MSKRICNPIRYEDITERQLSYNHMVCIPVTVTFDAKLCRSRTLNKSRTSYHFTTNRERKKNVRNCTQLDIRYSSVSVEHRVLRDRAKTRSTPSRENTKDASRSGNTRRKSPLRCAVHSAATSEFQQEAARYAAMSRMRVNGFLVARK